MAAPPPPPPPPVSDRLSNDARLGAAGDRFLRSGDGRYRLVMQHDGNIAAHPNSFVTVHNDGNVVIYSNGRPIWSTGSAGRT
jgi:hypothetical protein